MCTACVSTQYAPTFLLSHQECKCPFGAAPTVANKSKSSQCAGNLCRLSKVARTGSDNSSSSESNDCSNSSVFSLVHAVKAVQGSRAYMEDSHSVVLDLMGGSRNFHGQINFYGVFDGHGGDYVAKHCATALPRYLQQALVEKSQQCAYPNMHLALATAYERTDAELKETDKAQMVGSTAVVALVDKDHFWIANCGDSRALLCRNGTGQCLTQDHTPERQDELMRINEAGGYVVNCKGTARVMGVLAMSRAVGDHFLREFGVIAKPDIYSLPRSDDDEFLVLASDGLFSVLTTEEVTELARKSLFRARERGASGDTAARIAANVLTKIAINRGAQDNVTVMVVELMNRTVDSC